jgi:hypothetical protein
MPENSTKHMGGGDHAPSRRLTVLQVSCIVSGMTLVALTMLQPTCLTSAPGLLFLASAVLLSLICLLLPPCVLLQSVNCLTAKLYQKEQFIDERHRHRWAIAVHCSSLRIGQHTRQCNTMMLRIHMQYKHRWALEVVQKEQFIYERHRHRWAQV